jgi:hypothetical protein
MLRFFDTKSIPTVGCGEETSYIVRLVKFVLDEATDDGGLADSLIPDKDDLELEHSSFACCEANLIFPLHI